jgi:hypothetical protein
MLNVRTQELFLIDYDADASKKEEDDPLFYFSMKLAKDYKWSENVLSLYGKLADDFEKNFTGMEYVIYMLRRHKLNVPVGKVNPVGQMVFKGLLFAKGNRTYSGNQLILS